MKFKKLNELFTKFSSCPVCDAKITETAFCFGGDVGILDGKIYLTDKPFEKELIKYEIDIATSHCNNSIPPYHVFDLKCENCDYYAAFHLWSPTTKMLKTKVISEIITEEVMFKFEQNEFCLIKNYKHNKVSISGPNRMTAISDISPKFLKLYDYKNLGKRLKSLLLFDE